MPWMIKYRDMWFHKIHTVGIASFSNTKDGGTAFDTPEAALDKKVKLKELFLKDEDVATIVWEEEGDE